VEKKCFSEGEWSVKNYEEKYFSWKGPTMITWSNCLTNSGWPKVNACY